MSDQIPDAIDRRDLLKLGAAGLGAAVLGTALPGTAEEAAAQEANARGPAPAEPFSASPMDVVRIGFVGVGLQGGSHVSNLLQIQGVELVALCDIDEPRLNEVTQWVVDAGEPRPRGYSRGDWDFVRMCEEEELSFHLCGQNIILFISPRANKNRECSTDNPNWDCN